MKFLKIYTKNINGLFYQGEIEWKGFVQENLDTWIKSLDYQESTIKDGDQLFVICTSRQDHRTFVYSVVGKTSYSIVA